MKTSTAILIAVAMTAFVLVLAVGLIYAVNTKTSAPELGAPSQLDSTPPSSDGQIVESAPTRMSQPTIAVPNPSSPTQAPQSTQKTISADRAAQIALRLLPGSILRQPAELVNYKGKMAYEVMLNVATVYVDAFNGIILGSAPVVVENQPPVDSGGGGGGGGGGENVASNSNVPHNEPPANDGGGGSSGGGSHDDGGGDDGGHDDDGGGDDGGHDDDGGGHDDDDGGHDDDDGGHDDDD